MIGQKYLLSTVHKLIENKDLPRFILIVGKEGSGRRTLAGYIIKQFKKYLYSNALAKTVDDIKIATMRDVINSAYHTIVPCIYTVPNIDDMSKEAQNSILKLIEEPPNRATFIMTVQDVNNVLTTIKSRAFTLFMDNYSAEEIAEYILSLDTKILDEIPELPTICETPGEVDTFIRCGEVEFYNFVDKVVDNVNNVTTANALKLLNELDLKADGKGYDTVLFLNLFMKLCMKRAVINFDYRESLQYVNMIQPTSEALTKLHTKAPNRNMILTNWIFDVRGHYESN